MIKKPSSLSDDIHYVFHIMISQRYMEVHGSVEAFGQEADMEVHGSVEVFA